MAEVRASYLQFIVRQCRHAPGGAGERILARIPPGDLAAIRAAKVTEWLPFAVHQTLQDAKNAEVGAEQAAEVTRMLTLVTLGTPLLGGFLTNVLRLVGPDPRPAFLWAPRAYSMIFRDCGRLEPSLHPTASLATIHLVDMPKDVAESRSFVPSVGHALATVYPITGFEGTCTLASWTPEEGRATFELTWSLPHAVR